MFNLIDSDRIFFCDPITHAKIKNLKSRKKKPKTKKTQTRKATSMATTTRLPQRSNAILLRSLPSSSASSSSSSSSSSTTPMPTPKPKPDRDLSPEAVQRQLRGLEESFKIKPKPDGDLSPEAFQQKLRGLEVSFKNMMTDERLSAMCDPWKRIVWQALDIVEGWVDAVNVLCDCN